MVIRPVQGLGWINVFLFASSSQCGEADSLRLPCDRQDCRKLLKEQADPNLSDGRGSLGKIVLL